jgi:ubiquinol-cytochrome c reductase cytochrome c subunit
MKKALFVLALTAGLASAQNAGNPEKGKTLFLKNNCYSCHGFDGHGGGAGVKLAPKPIALAAFIAYVRHPAVGSMPTFSAKVISDADLTDIRAYLATIPDPPAVKDITLLNQ